MSELDTLKRRVAEAEKERDRLQHIIDCADTPLMRDVMRDRDEAKAACNICERPWPHHWPACAYVGNVEDLRRAEARVAVLEAALKEAKTLIQRAKARAAWIGGEWEDDCDEFLARAALAGDRQESR